jgi:carboxymethylenebutenolidase
MTGGEIVIEHPVLAADGGRTFDGYLARPQTGTSPGLLIFTEMWGVAPSKTQMAEDYARRGWSALVPNMFWRSEFTGVVPFDHADRAWLRLKEFDFDRSAEDAAIAARWLRESPFGTGKIAAIGFCMGGRIAFLAASRAGIDAGIALYALGIAQHLDEVRSVSAPVQLHYGLNDEHILTSEIDAVAGAAKGNPRVELHHYAGAGHGFFTEGRPAYHPQAVAEASAHIDRLLSRLTMPDRAGV